jgi:hypothetical protein
MAVEPTRAGGMVGMAAGAVFVGALEDLGIKLEDRGARVDPKP